jgi:FkbM family methyltransferase
MADIIPNNQTLLGRLLRLPLALVPEGKPVPILRGPARGLKWIAGSGPHSNWLGFNEVRKRKIFEEKVRSGMIVYDIGANVGSYAMLASRLIGPKGTVVAFEPGPRNVEALTEHIRLNGLANVRIVAAALSDHQGTARFARAADRVTGRLDEAGDVEVAVTTVDAEVAASGLVPRCLKIDVEGAEAAVLRGAEKTLREHRPVVFVATHGADVDREVRAHLSRLRYAVAAVRGHADELVGEPL